MGEDLTPASNPVDDAVRASLEAQDASVKRAEAEKAAQNAGPVMSTDDELGMHDPMVDVSPNVEYLYYKCVKCSRKVFAGPGDTMLVVECTCTTGRVTDMKDREGRPRKEHGVMRLHKYSRPRVAADKVEKQVVTEPDLPASVVHPDEKPQPGKIIE